MSLEKESADAVIVGRCEDLGFILGDRIQGTDAVISNERTMGIVILHNKTNFVKFNRAFIVPGKFTMEIRFLIILGAVRM